MRLEIPGGLYHLTTRGNRREAIYLSDEDRQLFLAVLGKVCARFSWRVFAHCLMTNHYHLLVEIRYPNLSRGMRQLNGVYTQRFNRRHGRTGHVFEGRFRAQLVQKDRYLLAVSRYIVLNPVRAGIVRDPGAWAWSSFRAMVGRAHVPPWLNAAELLAMFASQPAPAIERYRQFVLEGIAQPGPWDQLRHGLFLGEEEFPGRLKKAPAAKVRNEIPKAQRRPLAKPLKDFRRNSRNRDEAMARAYLSGVYTMREIGEYFGVHYMTVSRAVRQYENRGSRLRSLNAEVAAT